MFLLFSPRHFSTAALPSYIPAPPLSCITRDRRCPSCGRRSLPAEKEKDICVAWHFQHTWACHCASCSSPSIMVSAGTGAVSCCFRGVTYAPVTCLCHPLPYRVYMAQTLLCMAWLGRGILTLGGLWLILMVSLIFPPPPPSCPHPHHPNPSPTLPSCPQHYTPTCCGRANLAIAANATFGVPHGAGKRRPSHGGGQGRQLMASLRAFFSHLRLPSAFQAPYQAWDGLTKQQHGSACAACTLHGLARGTRR